MVSIIRTFSEHYPLDSRGGGGGETVFRGDNLGSGKCIFYRGVLSHWGELTYGEIR